MCNVIEKETASKIELALGRRLPFFAVAQPGETSLNFYIQDFTDNLTGAQKSMTLSPFDISRHRAVTINGIAATVEQIADLPEIGENEQNCPNLSSISHEDYCCSIESIVKHLSGSPSYSKVVISRVIDASTTQNVTSVAAKYFEGFDDTLRYIWYHPLTGLWLGATPELLLDATNPQKLISMSLAGTRPATATGEWDIKNRREHDIVTRFISTVMGDYCRSVMLGDEVDVAFGQIKHLCTPVYGYNPKEAGANSLFDRLSPTPAVSGYPRETAMKLIDKFEQHDRCYYAGYIRIDNRAWVNLRCARVEQSGDTSNYKIFSGGGITALSSPDDEWQETSAKANALLKAISGSFPS
ncbi:MAG: chorismate-binding protein [Muribaculaceae bacterium]|nr:chorismate-binding protein [Muribaculaceae bacterium]